MKTTTGNLVDKKGALSVFYKGIALSADTVLIDVFDEKDELIIRDQMREIKETGIYRFDFNTEELKPGVYLIKMYSELHATPEINIVQIIEDYEQTILLNIMERVMGIPQLVWDYVARTITSSNNDSKIDEIKNLLYANMEKNDTTKQIIYKNQDGSIVAKYNSKNQSGTPSVKDIWTLEKEE